MAPWPLPQEYQQGSSTLWLSPDLGCKFKHEFTDRCGGQHALRHQTTDPEHKKPSFSTANLNSAFERLKNTIFSEQFVPFKFHPKNAKFEPGADESRNYIERIIVEVQQRIDQQEDADDMSNEAYTVQIPKDGVTVIKAVALHGVLHAFNTFSQLFYAHSCCEC